ncbi:MAG: AAA family ATPase [Anaerolineae bacterium]
MTTTIAVAGKGGTGKTTICALVIRTLTGRNLGPVLAIDADPSSNLNLALGLELDDRETVGHIREDMLEQVQEQTVGGVMAGGLVSGLTKSDYFDYHIRSIVVEGHDIDLLAMGRPEGPGCYCPANNALRVVLERISSQYPFVVMDNEAGLEHLSRRTTRDVDHLLIVSDPTQRGLVAARRVADLIDELNITVKQAHIILNRLPTPDVPPALLATVRDIGLPLLAVIPEDRNLQQLEYSGQPVVDLPPGSPLVEAVTTLTKQLV